LESGQLTKAERKRARADRKQTQTQQNNSLALNKLTPLTSKQSEFFKGYSKSQVLVMHGYPGTGKSFLALYKALEDVLKQGVYKNVKIVRSSVSVREAGFLPGGIGEKMAVFEAPYVSICSELFGRGDAYGILKTRKQLEFLSTAHMRGITFRDTIVVIDECQNMAYGELNTLLTRIGSNCKVIVCGDIYQDDLTSERYKETSGFADVIKILETVPNTSTYHFDVEDIVRSGFVKDFIIAKINFERR
jgi:phosphate starvation-inducible protein PhoH